MKRYVMVRDESTELQGEGGSDVVATLEVAGAAGRHKSCPYRFNDQTMMAQPARKARPPIGVTAPSQRMPVALSR